MDSKGTPRASYTEQPMYYVFTAIFSPNKRPQSKVKLLFLLRQQYRKIHSKKTTSETRYYMLASGGTRECEKFKRQTAKWRECRKVSMCYSR